MSEVSVELEIKNLKGLHARAAAAFVKSTEGLDVDIFVEKLRKRGCCAWLC